MNSLVRICLMFNFRAFLSKVSPGIVMDLNLLDGLTMIEVLIFQ